MRVLLYLLPTLVIGYTLRDLFSSVPPAGWDLTPHYYLYELLLSYLSQGRLSGYDWNWFGGYPAFVLYPPLGYVILALPYLLSFGAVSPGLSFNLVLLLIPLAFIAAFQYVSRVFFGDRAEVPAVLLALLFLFAPREVGPLGLGLAGEVYVGLVSGSIGAVLLLLLIAFLERIRRNPSVLTMLAAGGTLSLIFLTHTMTGVFAVWLLLCFALVVRKFSFVARLGTISIFSLCVSAWWWMPFLSEFWLHGGQTLGLTAMTPDPLFGLYPRLNTEHLVKLLAAVRDAESWRGWISELPLSGLTLAICALVGLCSLIRGGSYLLPVIFLSSLILLPRDFFGHGSDSALHFYRFVQPVAILSTLIGVWGFMCLSKIAPRISTAVLFLVALYTTSIGYNLFSPLPSWLQYTEGGALEYHLRQEDYQAQADAQKMVKFIGSLQGEGRIAVESSLRSTSLLGSPHYFTTTIPRQTSWEVLPGLLAESSFSAGFINPTLRRGSDSVGWGRMKLNDDDEFTAQSLSSMIERLRLFNAEYLLASSRHYLASLETIAGPQLPLVKQFGPFALFKIPDPRSFLSCSAVKPLLFIDEGGISFRDFAESWYKEPALFSRPVIFTKRNHLTLPPTEREQIGGFVISLPPGNANKIRERWMQEARPVFFVQGEVKSLAASLPLTPTVGESSPPELLHRDAQHLKFNAHCGLLISASFASGWQSVGPEQTVFLATPSLMFIFGRGETDLVYNRNK